MRILRLPEIRQRVSAPAAIAAVAEGFAAYSRGEVTGPPVAHLGFDAPPGDVHIKAGWRRGDEVFVVKVASGFYANPQLGLPSSNGLMLVFSARTGAPEALLLDEGWLTDLRTAAAGAVAARHLAPDGVAEIGLVGAGIQARFQLDLLRHVTPCRRAVVWARDFAKARAFAVEGFAVEAVRTLEELAARARLIVTTTPAREPLLRAEWIRPGTHVTAVGADAPGKQELDPALFARAAVRAVDSRVQCFHHGDSSHALRAGLVGEGDFAELGEIVAGTHPGRTAPDQITVADLTGLAVQDIQVAKLAAAP